MLQHGDAITAVTSTRDGGAACCKRFAALHLWASSPQQAWLGCTTVQCSRLIRVRGSDCSWWSLLLAWLWPPSHLRRPIESCAISTNVTPCMCMGMPGDTKPASCM